jgi:hypothetical protein
VLDVNPPVAPVKEHEPIDSSLREQNRAALVGSGEHPGLRCPRTNFADRRRLLDLRRFACASGSGMGNSTLNVNFARLPTLERPAHDQSKQRARSVGQLGEPASSVTVDKLMTWVSLLPRARIKQAM